MVRALSQPQNELSNQRPGTSQSQGSDSRPLSSELQSERRSSVQGQFPSLSRKTSHYPPGHKRNSSLNQLDASNLSGLPSQLQQYAPVEKRRNPPSSQIPVPSIHNLEAGLAQFELSPSTSESGASFELLTLPDFSSLSTCDPSVPEPDPAPTSGDLNHAALPVFLDPGSNMAFSPPQPDVKTRLNSLPIPLENLMQASSHGFIPGDLSSILGEVARENKRLSHCLLESNRFLQKMEEERLIYPEGFRKASELVLKVLV